MTLALVTPLVGSVAAIVCTAAIACWARPQSPSSMTNTNTGALELSGHGSYETSVRRLGATPSAAATEASSAAESTQRVVCTLTWQFFGGGGVGAGVGESDGSGEADAVLMAGVEEGALLGVSGGAVVPLEVGEGGAVVPVDVAGPGVVGGGVVAVVAAGAGEVGGG